MMPHLRLATTEDAPAIQAIYAPIVETTVISFELVVPSVEEMVKRIDSTLEQHPWLVCEDRGQCAGYAYASQHRARRGYQWAADVSVYVHPGWHRRGIGGGLYRALLALLAAQGYYVAFAGITLPNPGSVGLHESVGFAALGVYRNVGYKLGAWHDVGWWQCDLLPRAHDPHPPIPIAEIVGSDTWHAALAKGIASMRA